MSFPLFVPVGHCFGGWSKINLKVHDVINCLNRNSVTHFVWYIEKEKRYYIETLPTDGVSAKEHHFWVSWVKKTYPWEFLRPEVTLSRSYLRKCSIWLGLPSSINLFFKNAIKSESLEANIFGIFTSLWYLPLVKITKKIRGKGDISHGITQWSIFRLSNRCNDHCKKFMHFHSSSCQGDTFLHQNHETH